MSFKVVRDKTEKAMMVFKLVESEQEGTIETKSISKEDAPPQILDMQDEEERTLESFEDQPCLSDFAEAKEPPNYTQPSYPHLEASREFDLLSESADASSTPAPPSIMPEQEPYDKRLALYSKAHPSVEEHSRESLSDVHIFPSGVFQTFRDSETTPIEEEQTTNLQDSAQLRAESTDPAFEEGRDSESALSSHLASHSQPELGTSELLAAQRAESVSSKESSAPQKSGSALHIPSFLFHLRVLQELESRLVNQILPFEHLEGYLAQMPSPSQEEYELLWSQKGATIRSLLNTAWERLALLSPDTMLFRTKPFVRQTTAEFSLYLRVMEALFRRDEEMFILCSEIFVDKFPHSVRSLWLKDMKLSSIKKRWSLCLCGMPD